MASVISIDRTPPTGGVGVSDPQPSHIKRQKTTAVLRRLRAGQNLCKIGLSEGIGWKKLTEILMEFIDWPKANDYICGNRRVA